MAGPGDLDEIVEERTKQELETLEAFLQFLEEEWAPWYVDKDLLRAHHLIHST
jgi:hypothetical protein